VSATVKLIGLDWGNNGVAMEEEVFSFFARTCEKKQLERFYVLTSVGSQFVWQGLNNQQQLHFHFGLHSDSDIPSIHLLSIYKE
jgi:hypothetical protein